MTKMGTAEKQQPLDREEPHRRPSSWGSKRDNSYIPRLLNNYTSTTCLLPE
ncbi:hypothetical protein [Photobacterium carnosum]|jgi:hypothetical protein|uniref:hypothetical protein n=1 Tax=Photobacterium carnosum TaxID=2023717 RepID=UPI00142D4F88|nr:hypothetical protein [Photobacterium carnosum]MCD9496371.1 hypothetical protein [Photobacterium carnosum]MCD9497698.1 hypothetical protein [Photobacterium carnosum]MCD9527788.1 hypothetical protein [Photobacterium carnosum]MCD9529057.1 hypothetical protein [Photobacterium carnosum]MCD9542446.1 hypothetical protein [Photobacterium carnosum]